ncbi:HTH-type transcriptional regulator LeuO [Cupriavidus sp. H19C3]|uniref:LysR family transcriptional regulator n=1 Tax=Cupriavidus sp. H19C3 TaxID=3241603 RepID=UPI0011D56F0D|nr:MAG: LysR family transcriptional regulator [Cupriavidus sp.]
MNLRALDLNLLVIFDALMSERHVTRAANKIAMSQPAMSNALARLRHIFKDELFIRGAGGMEPTPRALELGEAVQQILRQTERLLSSDVEFDPATSDREFTVRMSDLVGYLTLPRISEVLTNDAPGVSLNILHMAPERTLKSLESDQLDLGLSMELNHSSSIRAEPLFQDRMVCIMRAKNPAASKPMTLRRFLSAGHLRVSMSPTDIRFVDNILAAQGLQRRVVLNVPHWLLVPKILESTDLLAVTSEKLARHFLDDRLVLARLPFDTPQFHWNMYWHRRYDRSHAHTWLRAQVKRACAGI